MKDSSLPAGDGRSAERSELLRTLTGVGRDLAMGMLIQWRKGEHRLQWPLPPRVICPDRPVLSLETGGGRD